MNKYRYQLVLQFAATGLADFENLVRLEESLSRHTRTLAEVDGHDFGSGEFNIFILTDCPEKIFEISEELRRSELPNHAPTAAYRELIGDSYTVLSPPGQTEFRVS
jgi:hypothetical protein